MKHIITILIMLCLISRTTAQINCSKIPFVLSNHIQNPSFEPVANACIWNIGFYPDTLLQKFISNWQFANNQNGVYYLGECNNYKFSDLRYLIGSLPNMPTPIPYGKNVLGFVDYISGTPAMPIKQYIATNLTKPLKKDSVYKVTFYLGFGTPTHIYPDNSTYLNFSSGSPEKFAIYGLADSSQLPGYIPPIRPNSADPLVNACIADRKLGWISLGTTTISGTEGSWVKDSIIFTAPKNIQAIAIGSACDSKDLSGFFIYYLNGLQFYQSSVPKIFADITASSLCDNANAYANLLMRSASFYNGSQLQWYKNGVALNEFNPTLNITKNKYGEGWYQCGVMNDSVCIRSDSVEIKWTTQGNIQLTGFTDTTACTGDTLRLNADLGSGYSYRWSDGVTTPVRSVTKAGAYTVSISDNQCTTTSFTRNIHFEPCFTGMSVPSAFTPNHDGLNDVFRARYQSQLLAFSMSIYNRNGQRIFYSTDISKGWDGTINRVQQNQASYIWVIEYTEANGATHSMNGTVVLIR